MEAIKGLARRATQSVRGTSDAQDDKIPEVTRKVRAMEKAGVNLSDKILKVARLMGELGQTLKEIADEYKAVPDLLPEMTALADETLAMGHAVATKAGEFQTVLKEQGFDQIGLFLRELPKLRDAEEDRKKKQLEYDFFKNKVADLRKNPPKDTSRIPRNEGILENWRQELWKSTENLKQLLSNLHASGQRALDQSVLTVDMTVTNFAGYTAALGKQHFVNARLPMYSPAPILPPMALPPNPLVPFYSPGGPGGVPANQSGVFVPGVGSPQQQPPYATVGGQPPQVQPSVLNYGYQTGAQQPPPQQQQQPSWGLPPPQAGQPPQNGYDPNAQYHQQAQQQAQQQPQAGWGQQQQPAPAAWGQPPPQQQQQQPYGGGYSPQQQQPPQFAAGQGYPAQQQAPQQYQAYPPSQQVPASYVAPAHTPENASLAGASTSSNPNATAPPPAAPAPQ